LTLILIRVKKLGQCINELINKSKHKEKPNINLCVNVNLISNPTDISNIFSDYFSSIASKIRSKTPKFGNFEDYISRPKFPNSFFLKPVTTAEMLKTIKSLNQTLQKVKVIPILKTRVLNF